MSYLWLLIFVRVSKLNICYFESPLSCKFKLSPTLLISIADAYKDNFVGWKEVKAKVIRPNMECTNGIIHMIDTVLIDDAPPWEVGGAGGHAYSVFVLIVSLALVTLFGSWH